ncbi:hypothetical protein QVD17_34301 [Tagetes erecta]|uniref:Uncharacterized protein n=1 Tax=Tagetes erecta TaxID=13708 RepID=A0AAD8K0I0_TARER|nr:hypothetical protein QVD17_34301 [Tagetes erecta]
MLAFILISYLNTLKLVILLASATAPRGVYELAEDSSEVGDEDNEDEEHVFQDNERLVSTETSDDDLLPITHVHEAIVEEVNNINDDDDDDGVEAEFEDTGLDDDDVEEFEYSDSD